MADHANVLSATRLRPPEMRVSALSKSYFGQSTIAEFIRHPSSRAPCPQPMIPPGVLLTGLAWMVNHKNVEQRWRQDGLLMPQRRRRKRLASSSEPESDRVSVGLCGAAAAHNFLVDSLAVTDQDSSSAGLVAVVVHVISDPVERCRSVHSSFLD